MYGYTRSARYGKDHDEDTVNNYGGKVKRVGSGW